MDDSWNPFFSFCWTISFPSHLTCIPHHATSPDDCWYHYVGISVVGLNPHLSFHGFAHSRWLHFRPKKNQINRVHSLHQSQSSCLLVTPSFDSRNSTTTGWWLGHPSEKYEFVNWDDDRNPIFLGKFNIHGNQSPATRPGNRWTPFFPTWFPFFPVTPWQLCQAACRGLDWTRSLILDVAPSVPPATSARTALVT